MNIETKVQLLIEEAGNWAFVERSCDEDIEETRKKIGDLNRKFEELVANRQKAIFMKETLTQEIERWGGEA